MALIYSSALVTAFCSGPGSAAGDLHGFDLQRAALQRGGGIEIFVNFAGGAGQVSPIATGGDGTEFVQRQLWVIGVEFLAELTDRLVKARRAGEQVGLPRSSIRSLRTTRAGRRQGPSAHLTTKLSTSSCPSFLFCLLTIKSGSAALVKSHDAVVNYADDDDKEKRMTLQQWLFSIKGRIGRRDFWIWIAIWLVTMSALFTPAGSNLLNLQTAAFIIVCLLWPTAAVVVKRLHDRGKSGLWALLMVLAWMLLAGNWAMLPQVWQWGVGRFVPTLIIVMMLIDTGRLSAPGRE